MISFCDIDHPVIAKYMLKTKNTFRAIVSLKNGQVFEETVFAETVGQAANVIFEKYDFLLECVQIGGKK